MIFFNAKCIFICKTHMQDFSKQRIFFFKKLKKYLNEDKHDLQT